MLKFLYTPFRFVHTSSMQGWIVFIVTFMLYNGGEGSACGYVQGSNYLNVGPHFLECSTRQVEYDLIPMGSNLTEMILIASRSFRVKGLPCISLKVS